MKKEKCIAAFESLRILDACGICKQRLNAKEEESKSDVKTPVKRKRGKREVSELLPHRPSSTSSWLFLYEGEGGRGPLPT